MHRQEEAKGLRKGWIIASVFLALMLVLSACGGGQKTGSESDKNVLRVGTDAAYPPFEKQEGSGEITGFDIDVIKAIAEAEGLKVQVEHTGWDGLFEAVDSGKVDAGISAITITKKRKKKYDFSEPYFEAKQLILVPNDSDVSSLKDLKGKKIGVQSGTTGEIVVQKAFGKTYEGIRGYDDTPGAIDDLVIGRVDAVVADNGVVLDYMKKLPKGKFKTVEDNSFEPEFYGIMVKKGNKEVLDKINSGLKKIQEDGTFDEIYKKYFGQDS
ncbi:MAG: basic amino acid ABC transporter substrate-binding protein [Thermoactinomycetaceae bacterium]|jgi:ABC-type amino acid transport substrate-binding protein|nr:basic amino acid ABC transporter substrate-binding protein [Bacillota bacterium]MBO2532375.1 basic amino acid ABC transporter substrate-binding protein [Thermoactinomycetaceae bacterium]